ncbi:hypothetical protein BDQ12DRAFT_716060 [Crucibulum laeve]|uniref:Uncharacterized protein n=1 Tax=Crucibulum laeve TaxID=68775 RepID=A0A5C3LLC5_9AGAR|nr:hypothetical protein BDQ12DRAFT_716060 [Crucibulum laeve]
MEERPVSLQYQCQLVRPHRPFCGVHCPLLKPFGSLPSRISGCQYMLTPDEHTHSLHHLNTVRLSLGLSRHNGHTSCASLLKSSMSPLSMSIIDAISSLALSCKRVLDERSAEAELLPRVIMHSHTDLKSTDDELGLHEKQERYLLKALGKMSGLRALKWKCNHSPLLQEVEICDNLAFMPLVREEAEAEDKVSTKKIPKILLDISSMVLKSTQHAYGASQNPELSRIAEMLAHCPNITHLDIAYTHPRHQGLYNRPLADEFLLYSRWPNLISVSLTNLRCTPASIQDTLPSFLHAHQNIEVLALDIVPPFALNNLALLAGSLPRPRELQGSRDIDNVVLGCPTQSQRPLELLRGFKLSGAHNRSVNLNFLDLLRLAGNSIKRLELSAWNDMEDIKLLAGSLPSLSWLDIGSKHNSCAAPQNRDKTVTNTIEWATVLSELPELTTFHGVKFFYEVCSQPTANLSSMSMTDRSRMRKNDEIAGVLAWKCPKLRRMDHWEEGGGKVIVLLREGAGGEEAKVRWDVRRVKT